MATNSKIEWTDATWNPIVGCSIVSPGCTNCYAMTMAARLERIVEGWEQSSTPHASADHYRGTTRRVSGSNRSVWTGKVALAPERILLEPLRWRKPRRIFVNSMGDLFHEQIPDEWIDRVFAIMALCPQHTFQVLTKRPERMRDYIIKACRVPFPGVWLGTSCEDQQRADERIPILLDTPAAVRFVSTEPLLGPIDFTRIIFERVYGTGLLDALTGEKRGHVPNSPLGTTNKLDWVIVGGESGPNARPMHPDWARSIRDQCMAAAVPFYFKQHGEWLGTDDDNGEISYGSHQRHGWDVDGPRERWAYRVGKSRAGRLLDGVEHNAFPEVTAHLGVSERTVRG